jgi:hypothetical protein
MQETRRVRDLIASVDHGDPWHGSSTRDVLKGITAQDAATRPISDAHTIWEIVLHLTAWTREVGRRVHGGEPRLPEEGDWPTAPGPTPAPAAPGTPAGTPAAPTATEGAWAEALAGLAAAHASLIAALDDFPDSRLDGIVGSSFRDLPLGTGTSYGAMLLGIALHDAYHTGQIALLKKAIAERR